MGHTHPTSQPPLNLLLIQPLNPNTTSQPSLNSQFAGIKREKAMKESSLTISLLLGCFLPYGYGYGYGEEYDCEQEGVVYVHREFPDKPNGYKEGKTETWEICRKVCAKYDTCKGFTWFNENTCEDEYKRLCSLFSTYRWKAAGYWWTKTAVSGLKKCPKNAAGELKQGTRYNWDAVGWNAAVTKQNVVDVERIVDGSNCCQICKEKHPGTKAWQKYEGYKTCECLSYGDNFDSEIQNYEKKHGAYNIGYCE